MQPIDPLISEHRLIERSIAIMVRQRDRIKVENALDVELLDATVDFIRTYADRAHHGKEEQILFRDLAKKPLTEAQRKMRDQLIQEHQYVRNRVTQLIAARELFLKGSREALVKVSDVLSELVVFYPQHAHREEHSFFPEVMAYFSNAEKAAMLAEMTEYDARIIHEKYLRIIEALEEEAGSCRPHQCGECGCGEE